MADQPDERAAERVDKLVTDVLGGRHLKATPSDAAERGAIQMVGRLAGIRHGYPRMSPGFRRRLTRLLEKSEAPPWMNRRSALIAGLGLAAGAAGGALTGALAGSPFELFGKRHLPPPSPNARGQAPAERGIIEPRAELARWVDTGLTLADLAENVPHRVAAGAVGAFVVRRGDQVMGMSSYCTHLPCELAWQPSKKLLNCPCHNLAFDVDGQSTRETFPLPALPFVKVRVRNDGHVEVLGT
jgi:nitrite reductase/ring-hydroxylating ferredoxin subunit